MSTPPDPSKLTLTKQRWAQEGRFLTGRTARDGEDRLPPGQHVVRDWPVLDLGVQPRVAPEAWELRVFGLVGEQVTWRWADFLALPQRREVSDMHCVTTWSRFDNQWDGVATRDVLALVQPKPEARFVVLHSYDGYTTNLPLDDFAAEDAIIAHAWQGEPLPVAHGGPVRLIVPHLYLWKSAKWLHRIELIGADRAGYWEERGYHDRGDPWTEQRYSD
ncbi:MAG: sulfite oxidase-like oxidoreductase [Acetobacteraceae bacterium]